MIQKQTTLGDSRIVTLKARASRGVVQGESRASGRVASRVPSLRESQPNGDPSSLMLWGTEEWETMGRTGRKQDSVGAGQ